MKRSDIRNAYNRMNPTRDQKDKMLNAILAQAPAPGAEKKEYQARQKQSNRWSWVPAAAALIVVIFGGLLILCRPADNTPQLSAGLTEPVQTGVNLTELEQFRAGQEWYDYLQENAGALDDGSDIFSPYSTWGCVNQAMVSKLDEICGKYSLIFRDQDERMTDSFSYLLEEVGIETVLKDEAAHKTTSCAWWEDGQFYFAGTVSLNQTDSDWIYPVSYVFHRSYPNVFLYQYLEAASVGDLDCWQYTNEAGQELVLALGDDLAFVYVDGEKNVFFVEVENPRVGDVQLGEKKMGREDLEAFAETFRFAIQTKEYAPGDSVAATLYVMEETEALDLFASDIKRYVTALEEKWDAARCAEEGISILISNFAETPDKLGYAFLDLDLNGDLELLITDGNVILDLYRLSEEGPEQVFTGWERNVYYLRDGFLILNRASNSAFSTTYHFLRLVNGSLLEEQKLIFDAEEDPENPWLHQDGEDTPISVTEEQAQEILNSYASLTIPFTPFTQYR